MILPGTGRGTGEAGGGGVRQMLRPEVSTARKFRRSMSLPEVILWQRLRGGAAGAKIRRQHPVGPYIVDFYCSSASMVIEVDGQAHDCDERSAFDTSRDDFLQENGFRIVRILAADILRDVDAVAASIAAIVARPLHQPVAGPPPRSGEDQE